MPKEAIEINIDASELTNLQVSIKSAISTTEANVKKAMLAFGYNVQADAIETIQQGPKRTGTIYFVAGKQSQRSAYGEPAKTDTGMLANSVRVIQAGSGSVDVGYLKNIAPYGEQLEDKSKLNRPVLKPSFEKNRPILIKLIEKAVRDSLNG